MAPLPSRRIALVCTLGNPLATAWLLALQTVGHRVVVIDLRERPAGRDELERWAVPPGTVIITARPGTVPDVVPRLGFLLDGAPEVVLGWWGRGVLHALQDLRRPLPGAALLHVVDTFPDAANGASAAREVLRYRRAASAVDGWVHYSPRMRAAFVRRIPAVRHDPWVAIWEAFPSTAFSKGRVGAERTGRPTLVYSGRTDLLWGTTWRMAKDAQGAFLIELGRLGVQVIVSAWDQADQRGHRFDTYPRFSNVELLDGTFARHMDVYDAQLVSYREANRTIRRRVGAGLSTRLASALTSTTPVAVSQSSTFVLEEWARTGRPWGFAFDSPESLAAVLHDRPALGRMRAHMAASHRRYSLDRQMMSFEALADHAIRVRSAMDR